VLTVEQVLWAVAALLAVCFAALGVFAAWWRHRFPLPDPGVQRLPDGVDTAWRQMDAVLQSRLADLPPPPDGSHDQYRHMDPAIRAVVIAHCEAMWTADERSEV